MLVYLEQGVRLAAVSAIAHQRPVGHGAGIRLIAEIGRVYVRDAVDVVPAPPEPTVIVPVAPLHGLFVQGTVLHGAGIVQAIGQVRPGVDSNTWHALIVRGEELL